MTAGDVKDNDVVTYTDEDDVEHELHLLPLTEEEKRKNVHQDMVDSGHGGTVFQKEKVPEFPDSSYPKNELVSFDQVIFHMGTDDKTIVGDGEQPARPVKLSPFSIDKFEVSNGEFAEFVETTGYITEVNSILKL